MSVVTDETSVWHWWDDLPLWKGFYYGMSHCNVSLSCTLYSLYSWLPNCGGLQLPKYKCQVPRQICWTIQHVHRGPEGGLWEIPFWRDSWKPVQMCHKSFLLNSYSTEQHGKKCRQIHYSLSSPCNTLG